jgi:acetoin utilization deacetylase AcuC-like enzyme
VSDECLNSIYQHHSTTLATVKAFYSDHFVLPLPAGHRFPMSKYRLLRDAVSVQSNIELNEAPAATDTQILLAHSPRYLQAVIRGELSAKEQREIGFPWSLEMVERSRRSVGATLAACEAASVDGISVNLAGGTHHAYRDRGSGFCVFNDAAIAAKVLQRTSNPKTKIAIIDLDVHQGDGTAAIFQGDATIFTLSLHGARNYPFNKQQSSLDVPLPDGCQDEPYLEALAAALAQIKARFEPQFVLYLAGADPHESDRLGRLKLTKAGMGSRDLMVMQYAQSQRCPMAIMMAGGYSTDVNQIVDIHLQTVRLAAAQCNAV